MEEVVVEMMEVAAARVRTCAVASTTIQPEFCRIRGDDNPYGAPTSSANASERNAAAITRTHHSARTKAPARSRRSHFRAALCSTHADGIVPPPPPPPMETPSLSGLPG